MDCSILGGSIILLVQDYPENIFPSKTNVSMFALFDLAEIAFF